LWIRISVGAIFTPTHWRTYKCMRAHYLFTYTLRYTCICTEAGTHNHTHTHTPHGAHTANTTRNSTPASPYTCTDTWCTLFLPASGFKYDSVCVCVCVCPNQCSPINLPASQRVYSNTRCASLFCMSSTILSLPHWTLGYYHALLKSDKEDKEVVKIDFWTHFCFEGTQVTKGGACLCVVVVACLRWKRCHSSHTLNDSQQSCLDCVAALMH